MVKLSNIPHKQRKIMSDVKYEDHKETVDKLAYVILNNWLSGEGDTSWSTINEYLYNYRVSDSEVIYSEDEKEAIVSWAEDKIVEAMGTARVAIFGE
jgi:hypothetical protein